MMKKVHTIYMLSLLSNLFVSEDDEKGTYMFSLLSHEDHDYNVSINGDEMTVIVIFIVVNGDENANKVGRCILPDGRRRKRRQ